MKNSKGIIYSILIHLLILFLFLMILNKTEPINPAKKHKEEKIEIDLEQLIVKKEPPVKKVIKKEIIKPKPKPKEIEKKEVKEEKIPTKTKKQPIIKKEKIKIKEVNATKIVKQIKPKVFKPIIKKEKKRKYKNPSKDPLSQSLTKYAEDFKLPTVQTKEESTASIIRKLYGKEFKTFSKSQKIFILKNLETIHQITQRVLIINGYPESAVRTKQQGVNIVSFYLHPNGDISELKLKKEMGYEVLDKNTLEVIEIAYKHYPQPKKKTKIIFYVKYEL